ncbi:DNA alkylation repair protein [Neoaquamicrobium sediminum]|uniref:DNA alkylation repair protein n=1 Tax=Neoaquamicrobium sediminum TaxID=1849104 RepID=UPI003BA94978
MNALSRGSTADDVLDHLKSLGSEENRQGMLRYGIRIERALGISHGDQRRIAKAIGRDHERAFALWDCGITEAQFIASLTADPKRFTANDARQWAAEFDSWDIVDGVSDLFVDTDHWLTLIDDFAKDEREFVRRTAFAMMAWSVVHRKNEPEETFLRFLATIRRHADDERNFVRKAVSWALRSIGKRSAQLNTAALDLARDLAGSDDKTRRWIGKDAVRDLTSEKTRQRLERIANKASPKPRKA